MINTLLGKVFGTKNEREMKRLQPRVAAISALEPEMQKLSDEQLRHRIAALESELETIAAGLSTKSPRSSGPLTDSQANR